MFGLILLSMGSNHAFQELKGKQSMNTIKTTEARLIAIFLPAAVAARFVADIAAANSK